MHSTEASACYNWDFYWCLVAVISCAEGFAVGCLARVIDLGRYEALSGPRRSASWGASTHEDAPIVAAIQTFRDGLSAFNAMPTEITERNQEASIEATYGPRHEVPMNWAEPARGHGGAIEALRLARDEMADFADSYTSRDMIEAAFAYYQARRH